jgi:hypothetical protein
MKSLTHHHTLHLFSKSLTHNISRADHALASLRESIFTLAISVALVLIALTLSGPTAAGAARPAEGDLHGLWKVTSYLRQVVGTDEITMPMGAHPNGFLELRPDHRALYIVTAEDRKPFSKPPTPEEYRDKFITMPYSPEPTMSPATRLLFT